MTDENERLKTNEKKRRTPLQKLTITITVVAVLLLISLLLLLLSYCSDQSASSTGNIIDTNNSQKITLRHKDSEEESRFVVENMFPGDREKKSYIVSVKDAGVKAISFHAEVVSDRVGLAEVLMLSVTVDEAQEALYEGTLAAMPERLRAELAEGSAESAFAVSVSLDTSVTNAYANAEIRVDFRWWVEDADYVSSSHGGAHGGGDACCSLCRYLCLWCHFLPSCRGFCPWCWLIPLLLLLLLLLGLLFLLLWRRKKKSGEEEPVEPEVPAPEVEPASDEPTPEIPPESPEPTPPHDTTASKRRPHGYTKSYDATVSLDLLMALFEPGESVTLESLKKKGVVKKKARGYKVLIGDRTTMDRPLFVTATSFSAPARAAIAAAGGTAKRETADKRRRG